MLVAALGGTGRILADEVTSVRLDSTGAQALASLLERRTVIHRGWIYRLDDVTPVASDAEASRWAFDATLDPLAEVGDLEPHAHAEAARGVAWYGIAPRDACGREAQPLVGDLRRLDLANILVQRGDRFVWLAEAARKVAPALEGQLPVNPPQVLKGGARQDWESCAERLDQAARAFPLARIELYERGALRLDLRRSLGEATGILLDVADSWAPSRIRLVPRSPGGGSFALQARRSVAITCGEGSTLEGVGEEPWREVRGGDVDFEVARLFDDAVPPDFEARRAALLAGKPSGCDLVVHRVDLRILQDGMAIKTLLVTKPCGC